jgi:TonB-linked SusC/RagA family outer membrane protein
MNLTIRFFRQRRIYTKMLLIMRLTAIILLSACLTARAEGYSQITLNEKNVSLQKVIQRIQRQSGYDFLYNSELLQKQGKVCIDVRQVTLQQALEECLKDKPLTYSIIEKTVIIKPKAPVPNKVVAENILPPPVEIKGIVEDENGKPLSGASVLVKGTQIGVSANEKGEFTIRVPDKATILVFSYVGMESREVSIKGKTEFVITLKAVATPEQEIVVVGYGKSSRQKLTSAVSTIQTDEFQDVPYTDIQSALAGRVSGVMVNFAGGEPGSVPSMTIRGGEPLIGQTSPLYVIDGLVRDQAAFVALNINDISNISFLKDAAATAVYGSQAAAGIVLVTTRQGVAGNTQITYSDNISWNTPNLFPKLINSYQKALISNAVAEALGNGNYSVYNQAQLDTIKNGWDPGTYPNNNWYDLVFKKYSLQQTHNLSISGGTNQTKYYVGLGYFDQGSNYVNDAETYQRFSYRSNITTSFNKIGLDVTFGLNGYYSYQKTPPFSAGGIFSNVIAKSPLDKAYNKDGTFAGIVDDPLTEIYSPGYSRNESLFTDGTLTFVWTLPWIKGLKLTAIGDYSFKYSPSKTFTCYADSYNPDGSLYQVPNPTLSESEDITNAYNLEFHLDYSKSIGKHNFEATLVSNTRAGNEKWFSAYRSNFPSTAVDQMFAGDASTETNDGSASEYGNVGYVGRIKYDYASKYLVELSGRYDGSDYFPPGKRFGLFPSLGLGWVLSNEQLYKNAGLENILSFFKLRGSIGTTGSIGGTKYAYVPQYNVNTQVFVANGNLQNGYSEGALTVDNQNITWYSTRSYDWGFDFTALKKHLTGSFDYFFTRTKNILGNPKYSYVDPLGTSLPLVLTNEATRKEGIDGNLTYRNTISKNLSFYVGFNFTYYNYLWERSGEDSVTLTNPYTRAQGVNQAYYGTMYYSNGLYQNYNQILNNPIALTATALSLGDVWLQDVNGDGIINAQDNRRQGISSTPRFVYGFNFGITYKGFSLDGLLQGTGKKDVYLGQFVQGAGGASRDNFAFQTDYWTSTNTGAAFPRAGNSTLNNGNNYTNSNFWLINTQFLRLKSLSVAYDLKNTLLKKMIAFKELSVHVSGTNLLTFSPCKKYFDPELADTNNFFYPVNRTYSLGIRAGF